MTYSAQIASARNSAAPIPAVHKTTRRNGLFTVAMNTMPSANNHSMTISYGY